MRRYLVEFVGTLLFVTAIFGAVLTRPDLAPLGIGAALIALVYARVAALIATASLRWEP